MKRRRGLIACKQPLWGVLLHDSVIKTPRVFMQMRDLCAQFSQNLFPLIRCQSGNFKIVDDRATAWEGLVHWEVKQETGASNKRFTEGKTKKESNK